MTYDQINAAEEAMKQCPVMSQPHVLAQWKKVNWDVYPAQLVSADAEVSREKAGTINLYPSLEKKSQPEINYTLIREFAEMLYRCAPNALRRVWQLKLALPTKDQVDAFQLRLNQGFKSYRAVVESLHAPVDRLVAIHLANAMIANKLAFAGASNVDIRTWGPTSQYACLKRYHSLNPVVGAYVPQKVYMNFGEAVAESVLNNMKIASHTQVAKGIQGIIEKIVNLLR
jgi:hypothetical protein